MIMKSLGQFPFEITIDLAIAFLEMFLKRSQELHILPLKISTDTMILGCNQYKDNKTIIFQNFEFKKKIVNKTISQLTATLYRKDIKKQN